jgi:hypothetical protein
MTSNTNSKLITIISIAYFSIAAIEIISELFNVTSFPLLLPKIISPLLLLLLYRFKSEKQDPLFYILIFLMLLSNVFFFIKTTPFFLYGIITFILLRIIALVLTFKLIVNKNYLYILLATFPFLLIFFYLISVTNEIPEFEFNILILQSILISVLSGTAIASYISNENRQNSWLLISTLLFIGLYFIVFIECYFLADTIAIFKPIAVILNTFAFFTFYKFVITVEVNEKIK